MGCIVTHSFFLTAMVLRRGVLKPTLRLDALLDAPGMSVAVLLLTSSVVRYSRMERRVAAFYNAHFMLEPHTTLLHIKVLMYSSAYKQRLEAYNVPSGTLNSSIPQH